MREVVPIASRDLCTLTDPHDIPDANCRMEQKSVGFEQLAVRLQGSTLVLPGQVFCRVG